MVWIMSLVIIMLIALIGVEWKLKQYSIAQGKDIEKHKKQVIYYIIGIVIAALVLFGYI